MSNPHRRFFTPALDKIAFLVVKAIRRRASKRRFANFFVPINDPIGIDIISRGDYESTPMDSLMALLTNRDTIDLLLNTAGTCIDIGANIGLYTFAFSTIFSRVIALEANPITFKVLEANIALNAINNVSCLCKGASDEKREALLFVPRSGALGWATLTDECSKWGGGREQHKVHLDTLDNLVDIHGFTESPISFIKIDVDGHELAVLTGAVNTLQRWNLSLWLRLIQQRWQTISLIFWRQSATALFISLSAVSL